MSAGKSHDLLCQRGTGNPPPSRAGINDTSTPSTRAPQKIPLDPLVASGRTLFS